MKNKISLVILLLTGISLPLALHSGFSSPNIEGQETPQHKVKVTLKLIQVYVTDKQGNPVTDLTKDDFILYDNGKLQGITDLERHVLKKPPETLEVKVKESEEKEPSSRMNRKFLFLIDLFWNNLHGVSRSKKAALYFIETKLQPDDEVGIFSYSPDRGLILHQYFTSDPQKARKSIQKIKESPQLIQGMGISSMGSPKKGGTIKI